MKVGNTKYRQVEQYIINKINKGELKPGDQIETEHEISDKLNISHLTVNKALSNLANQGYLFRVRGKGSFVKAIPSNEIMSQKRTFSLSEDIEKMGKQPGGSLIEYKVILGKDAPEVAKAMGVDENEKMHYCVRVRTADGEPIAIAYTYLLTKVVPYIDITVLENGSLWKFLAEKGFGGTVRSFYKIYAKLPTKEQAKYLQITENTPLLLSHHISVNKDEVAYNYTDTYYISDRYEYHYISEPDQITKERMVSPQ